MGMSGSFLRRRTAALFVAAVLAFGLSGLAPPAGAQTSTNDTILRVLATRKPLPPPTDPYQRSLEDDLYRQAQRNQAMALQRAVNGQRQQTIDNFGTSLQNDLTTRRQTDTLLWQQYQQNRQLQQRQLIIQRTGKP